ncbi:PLP-dependent aminotransferase family protein [Pusillimonas sp. MFBS29]|uniref:aminotransferase-like domain-containing protein n=1 Tax=Pusillimonas sp. MFBS29 TaxID=2886690 RepID=UPI001D1049BD|nr:PLP-dependent aminotransferase family protein [Pusillimonas sp. MFBS29]MCC2594782.1 PLP-dependent aminotransferase family protein [Pusillimonas sp. MFBS29]
MQLFFEPVRDRKQAVSLVDQTVEAIELAIRQGLLRPGMPVPSIRQFAKSHGLSTFTVSAAYSRLVAGNLLTARPGSGYRVARTARNEAPVVAPASWVPPRIGASWLLADIFADHSIPIKSGCGWLPAEWLNEAGLQQSLKQVARTPVNQVAGYGHPYGYHPLREYIQLRLDQHGLPLSSDEILLTQGASQGLDIVIRTLLRPGDVIAVEQPCYANFLQLLRQAGLKVLSVPRDGNGLCLDTLDRLARQHNIKAMFVNTVLQNPTGTSLGMSNAFRLLQLAEQYDFRVIEDDVSRDLMPGLGPMLVALAGTGRVVYVSGFSKSIMPSMRVGYVVANATLLKEFAKTKMAMGLTSPEMMERMVHQVLSQGRHRAHLQRVQERLRQAHDELGLLMDKHGFEVLDRPQAGLFLWARPGGGQWREQGASRLAELALKDGIWLAPGSYFDPEQADTGWIRFNVAYSLHPALWRFMRKAGAAA